MFQLQGDQNAAIAHVEEPQQAVARLARLNSSGPEVATALAGLPRDWLRGLQRQAKAAIKRNDAAERPVEQRRPRVFSRPRRFGD